MSLKKYDLVYYRSTKGYELCIVMGKARAFVGEFILKRVNNPKDDYGDYIEDPVNLLVVKDITDFEKIMYGIPLEA